MNQDTDFLLLVFSKQSIYRFMLQKIYIYRQYAGPFRSLLKCYQEKIIFMQKIYTTLHQQSPSKNTLIVIIVDCFEEIIGISIKILIKDVFFALFVSVHAFIDNEAKIRGKFAENRANWNNCKFYYLTTFGQSLVPWSVFGLLLILFIRSHVLVSTTTFMPILVFLCLYCNLTSVPFYNIKVNQPRAGPGCQ